MISRERLVKTFCDLVQIDSPSGEEEAMAVELKRRLEALGLKVERDGYGNVIASDGGDEPILLSAHMDTVEPGRSIVPVVDSERIYSEGPTIVGGDCKAGVAAILEALESLTEDDAARGGVEVAFTREEEIGLVGARNLDFTRIRSTEAIVFDGEGPASQITAASPTYVGTRPTRYGPRRARRRRAGEGPLRSPRSRRDHHETAAGTAGRRDDLQHRDYRGRIRPQHGAGGGRRARRVPKPEPGDARRDHDAGERGGQRGAHRLPRRRHTSVDMETQFETYTLTDDDPATNRVKAALRALGLEPTMRPSGGGTDGNVFRQRGISAVVVGMADTNMHTVREFVTIPDLVDAAHLCEELLRR